MLKKGNRLRFDLSTDCATLPDQMETGITSAMISPLLLFVCLTAALRGITAESTANIDTYELGKGINVRKTKLLEDFHEREAKVFETLPENCFKRQKLHYSGSNFDYYASTKSFYKHIAAAAGLEASLESSFTLGTTLNSVIRKTESKESQVSGMTLNVRALTEKILVKKDCLDNVETSTLTKRFVKDFENLPLVFKHPMLANSWKAYNVFLETYGSHVITSVTRGASMKQTTFAESSKSYSQRDFQVKSCTKLAGPVSVTKVGVEACANVSKSEMSKASDMNTVDKLIIKGGKKETRNKLLCERSKDLIEKLLNEAGESDASIEHTFRPIWDILESRFDTGSENYIRAVNLQYYYLGFLNYGCRFIESRGVHIQKFDYTRGTSKESPEFECSLAAEGCHHPDDCGYRVGVWCACRGKSCVKYKWDKQDTGTSKVTGYANTQYDWGWHGCDWKVAGFECDCYNKNIGFRKQVWRMPSRDVAQKAGRHSSHHKSETPDQNPIRGVGRDAKENDEEFFDLSSGELMY